MLFYQREYKLNYSFSQETARRKYEKLENYRNWKTKNFDK